MTLKKVSIEYDAVNSDNTFTNGDKVEGRVIVETFKEIKIHSLVFIAKGKARVSWQEFHEELGYRAYWAEEKYYEVKHHILRKTRQDGTEVIGAGKHVFPFSYKIPDRKMPSSFESTSGKIVHQLMAEVKHSILMPKKVGIPFKFVSRANLDFPGLLDRQYNVVDKSIKVFGSGSLSLDVLINKTGFRTGETIQVTAGIRNNSSRSVKPKFVLLERLSFFAQGHSKQCNRVILKEKDEVVEPSVNKTVTKEICIPGGLPASILECSIMKLQYIMKVYLDIKYYPDPEIILPIIILPEVSSGQQQPAAANRRSGSYGDFSPPSWSNTFPQAAPQPLDLPPPYESYQMYPLLSPPAYS